MVGTAGAGEIGVLFPLIMFGVAFCCRSLFELSVGLSDSSVFFFSSLGLKHTRKGKNRLKIAIILLANKSYVDLLAIHVNNFTPFFII